jgi:thymidylate kinase
LTGSATPERRLELHPLTGAVFRALDAAGVRWCLLRGAEDLARAGGDVDLLVAPGDVAVLERAIAPLGLARLPAWGFGSHRFYLGYDATTDVWLKLDVVTELAFGPWLSLRTGAAAGCLRRRRREAGIAVLDDADAFWCLLLHRMLDKGDVGPAGAALRRLAGASAWADSPLAREVERIVGDRFVPDRLLDAARRGAWEELAAHGAALQAAWTRSRRLAVQRRRVAGRLARRASPLVRSRRGMTVALVGPDGAGKSSAAAALARSFPLPALTLYMSPAMTVRHPALPRGAGLAVLIAAQLGRWARGLWHRLRGRLVLFDRYASDALLPARWPLGRRGRLRRRLLGHACPSPQLTVVLDAPGDVLYARAGEHHPAVLEAERRAYLRLAQRRAAATVIDATREPDRVRRDVTAAVWAAYRRRWARPQSRLRPGASRCRRHSRSSRT